MRTLMICNSFKGKLVLLALALAVLCMGCSGGDDSTTSEQSEQGGDFTQTPEGDMKERIENLKLLLPEEIYNTITDKSRENPACIEGNRDQLGLPDEPNGQWYYTYENLIKGMAELEEFANKKYDENTRKLEIAAFLANIAQETGAKVVGDAFGSPGCAIQEGYGAEAAWHSCAFGVRSDVVGSDWGCNKTRPFKCPKRDPGPPEILPVCPDGEVGYFGRGPHQLTYDTNYEAFGVTMGVGDKYLKNPDLLTTDPNIGISGSIWFWGHEERTDSSPPQIPFKPSAHNVVVGEWIPTDSSTPGVRTSNDVRCGRTKANFGVIINLINGGVECGKATQEAKNRVEYLVAIAEAMGVTIPDGFLDNCSTQENFSVCPSY